MSNKFVLYYRASTQRQGQSGLGLEAQQQQAMQYLQQVSGQMIQEFVEVESGRKANRPELEKAIDLCRAYVLRRAKGVCELTGANAPFNKANGEPYLEVHHIRKLSDGGLDHPVNCAAITPNAHREIHFGATGSELDEKLAKLIQLKEENLANGE